MTIRIQVEMIHHNHRRSENGNIQATLVYLTAISEPLQLQVLRQFRSFNRFSHCERDRRQTNLKLESAYRSYLKLTHCNTPNVSLKPSPKIPQYLHLHSDSRHTGLYNHFIHPRKIDFHQKASIQTELEFPSCSKSYLTADIRASLSADSSRVRQLSAKHTFSLRHNSRFTRTNYFLNHNPSHLKNVVL
ncbi:hypothetical protein M758_UG108500 [Ceratodon purpureus]|nr:hypothetical protein M758_UG108500 [Ceratodon purpureus]